MSTLMMLGLASALGGAGLSPSTCGAQPDTRFDVRELSNRCARAYTPAKGGATRKQIADAMRRSVGQSAGVYVVFNFDWVKINGSWAYAETRPESPDGQNKYEPVSALLRRSKGLWRVVARAETDDETSPAQAQRQLRNRFPSAPRDVFPR